MNRQESLYNMYHGPFQNLTSTEKVELAWSGKVCWNHSQIAARAAFLSTETRRQLDGIRLSAGALANYGALSDPHSSVWNAFKLAMTHHSTAMEGNKLTLEQVKTCLDVFGDGIGKGIGISEPDSVDPELLMDLDRNDVVEVVNHAACMEYVRDNIFHGSIISAENIQQMYRVLMPRAGSELFTMASTSFSSSHGLYRRHPIKVRGSPTVRPYPQEVPALMHKILDVYHNKHMQEQDPVVAAILLMMNFLWVHPFHDGNGRVSRLILQTLLYQHGMFGCVLPVHEKQLFFSYMTPYFEQNEIDGLVSYIVSRIGVFHTDLAVYEQTKQIPTFHSF